MQQTGLTWVGAAKIASMPTACASSSVNDAFFAPIANLAETSRHARPCPEISDAQWIRAGIQRVLEDVPSGRAFLQEHGLRFAQPPKVSNYFSSLQSERRAAVLQDVIDGVLGQVVAGGMNRLGHIPELERYVCFAVDMHWHKAASHDEPYDGRKAAVGHCFSLQLHDQSVRHLAVGEGQHEHDMSVLQRLTPQGLRQGVPKGRRVLVIYDRAGVDLRFWKRCRHENAVYFLSRAKLNMIFEWAEERPWDPQDSRNHGVHHDQWVVSREGHRLRLIEYQDAESGREFMFLTNEPDLPPGVLAELYRRRWEVEKVFDEIKNKLGERKAWASSQEARIVQGRFVSLTYNLVALYQRRIEKEHDIHNGPEELRRKQRMATLEEISTAAGRTLSSLLRKGRAATQRSVKFIRWLRASLRDRLAEEAAVARLRHLYATW